MNNSRKKLVGVSFLLLLLLLSGCLNKAKERNGVFEQKPLAYQTSRQLVLEDVDKLGRAVDAHIQLKASDEPGHKGEKRAKKLNYNPVGWHNYRLTYTKENGKTGKAWLFDRGHLVGYQFSGLNDEAKNLVPETSQLNKGGIAKTDTKNVEGMLYYEQALDKWLESNPTYTLDYQVTPIYEGNELLPRQIRLAYTGFDEDGRELSIRLGSPKEEKGNHATVVYLDNVSSNAEIDYLKGTANQK